jgi:hypothetical protein
MIKNDRLSQGIINSELHRIQGSHMFHLRKTAKAQSFVEFALVLPILLLVLLGVVELTLFIGTYINLLDLTRESSRYASSRDPFASTMRGDFNCNTHGTSGTDNFFWDTSCILSQLSGSACVDPAFCNGFNSTIPLKSVEDDILISVFTETGLSEYTDANGITTPINGVITPNEFDNGTNTIPWVWSDHDSDTAHNANWRRDCNRLTTPVSANPTFTNDVIASYLRSNAMANKGFVVVEVVYCYHQVLNIPILSQFLPDPMTVHTYTVMPLPAAQPTRTPNTP